MLPWFCVPCKPMVTPQRHTFIAPLVQRTPLLKILASSGATLQTCGVPFDVVRSFTIGVGTFNSSVSATSWGRNSRLPLVSMYQHCLEESNQHVIPEAPWPCLLYTSPSPRDRG
eukprot:6110681-Amphidinium_carterae.1